MAIQNRYEFLYYVACTNANPNGDPDMGNTPRIDPQTMQGYITDVATKRRIRNYVETVKEGEPGYRIYIKGGVPLNRSDAEAFTGLGIDPKTIKDLKKKDDQLDAKVRDWMCSEFYDIRTFGAVMTTFMKNNLNCGQVRGPVQLGFARSVDPIVPQEVTITRVAITTEDAAQDKVTEMGRKYIVPYALYRCEGYVSARPPGFPKRTWLFSGRRSLTCLKTTALPPGARWPCASSSSSGMTASLATPPLTSCSTRLPSGAATG